MNGIIQYVAFCIWLPSLSMIISRFIYVVAWIILHSFLWPNNIPFCSYTTFCLSTHQWTFCLFPLFGYYEYCCYEQFVYKILYGHILSVLLVIYLRVEFLCHMATLGLIFWGTAKLFFKVAPPFYIPTRNVQGFQFLHTLTNTYYLSFFIIVILVGVMWYFIVVLICISLMTNDVDLLFMCLLAICISSSLEECLFRSFAHF